MASISEREYREIEAANASGHTPVVFIQGLWLLPSSWANWADLSTQAGYAPLTPDWPDDPDTVDQARANPGALAKKTLEQVAGHTTEIINALEKKPAVMGHSNGGLLAQMLAGRDCRRPRNCGVTEIVKMPNRGHSLTIDHGWREVAQTTLDFVKRFA